MRSTKILIISLLFIFIFSFSISVSTKAEPVEAVIDFEGIPPGTIVDSVYSGYGISGAEIEGFVIVDGYNPFFGEGVNTAMIFDARCPPGAPEFCTGGDDDLFQPDLGNTIIISEDLDTTDPDDADVLGAVIGFEYSQLGDGSGAFVDSITVHDIEEEQGELEDAKIIFYHGGLDGEELFSVDIPHTGNGNTAIVTIGVEGVDAMRVDLAGSGTIDNISFSSEPTAVTLLYFRVEEALHGNVKLTWATAAEIDNYGFKIYRSQKRNFSTAEEIHFEPAGGGTGGHTYFFTDTPPGNGPWVYWLTDIDTAGKETIHMPVFVKAIMSHVNYLPILVANR